MMKQHHPVLATVAKIDERVVISIDDPDIVLDLPYLFEY